MQKTETLPAVMHCTCITNHIFSLTDTAASASAILLHRSHAPTASGRHLFKTAVPPHVARPFVWPYPLHALPAATGVVLKGTPGCFTTERCQQSLGNWSLLATGRAASTLGTDPANASHLGRTTAITIGSNSPCVPALCTCCLSLLPLSTRISQCTTGHATPGLWDRFRDGMGPQHIPKP
jgi:hypothetical protein